MGSKLVLVTGASSGIGEATAKLYADKGAQVILLARNATRLEAVAEAIRRGGGTATAYAVDLADAAATADAAARIERERGVPDILINNAGAGRWLSLLDTTPEDARAMRGKNVITRAVGHRDYVEVDTFSVEIRPGDRFLICSDGLHGYLRAGEADLLLNEPTVEAAARRAIEVANERGGRDNITAVVVAVR